jgi:transporter family protein
MALSPQVLGLLVGGLVPAFCYGTAGVLAKVSTNAGMSVGGHLICIGVMVSVVGVVFQGVLPGALPSGAAIASSSLYGVLWGLGTGFVSFGLIKYNTPLAKLVPLYNMNTLIAVALALIIFLEWQNVDVLKLILGAIFVILGGVLVSIA